MSDSENEKEIKVEYFESYETDPLCENTVNLCDTDFSPATNVSDENINQHENVVEVVSSNENDNLTNNNPALNDVMVPENISWYKSLDKYGKYICKFCDQAYSTIQTVRHHIKNKHPDLYLLIKSTVKENLRRCKIKCHICKMRFKNLHSLQEHINIHGITNIQKSCFKCYATFDNNTELLTHMSNKHAITRKLNYCNLCGYSTSKLSHYKQHEKIHTRSEQRKCSYCEYSTNHQPNLKIHERTHTNIKPYVCTFNGCNYRCTAKSGLTSHSLKHETEKNMVYCDKCSYSTVYKQSLRKHMDSHSRNSLRGRF